MSGVFGYCSSQRPAQPGRIVASIGERLRHHSYFTIETAEIDARVALGRSGIGILNTGRQPVRSEDGRVTLVLVGEFFHQQDRRRSLVHDGRLSDAARDEELALAVYQCGGAMALTDLEGVFTLVVWDAGVAELVVINDRFGLYPHFIAHVAGTLAFAPEMKGVLATPAVSRRLDRVGIAQYVRFQHHLGDRTWFEDIKLLRPGSLLRYRPDDDRLSIVRYWDWDRVPTADRITKAEALDQWDALFHRAVAARVSPSIRSGVYLTGGLDARMMVAYAAPLTPLTTITFGRAGSRDVVYAARLARRAGASHKWFPLDDGRWVLEYGPLHQTLIEGQASWIHAHGMNTLQEARASIDVNLTGWRSARRYLDRQLNWPRHVQPTRSDLLQRLYTAFCSKLTWPGLTEAEAAALMGGQGDASLRSLAFDSFRDELSRHWHFPADRAVDQFWAENHAGRLTIQHVVFMRSAFEVRHPYFDYSFMDFMYGLPRTIDPIWRLRQEIITRRMPALALVPYDRTGLVVHSHPALR